MSIDYNQFLPNPADKENSKLSPEVPLERVADTISSRYPGRITGVVVSTVKSVDENKEVLSYTLYLVFHRHDNFNYPLISVECLKSDGSYPIKVLSHYGPPIDHGIIDSEINFEAVIEDILKEARTRSIILSMY